MYQQNARSDVCLDIFRIMNQFSKSLTFNPCLLILSRKDLIEHTKHASLQAGWTWKEREINVEFQCPTNWGWYRNQNMMVSLYRNGKVTWILLTSIILLGHVRALQPGTIVAYVQEMKWNVCNFVNAWEIATMSEKYILFFHVMVTFNNAFIYLLILFCDKVSTFLFPNGYILVIRILILAIF